MKMNGKEFLESLKSELHRIDDDSEKGYIKYSLTITNRDKVFNDTVLIPDCCVTVNDTVELIDNHDLIFVYIFDYLYDKGDDTDRFISILSEEELQLLIDYYKNCKDFIEMEEKMNTIER